MTLRFSYSIFQISCSRIKALDRISLERFWIEFLHAKAGEKNFRKNFWEIRIIIRILKLGYCLFAGYMEAYNYAKADLFKGAGDNGVNRNPWVNPSPPR
jgi:hypothetical protein